MYIKQITVRILRPRNGIEHAIPVFRVAAMPDLRKANIPVPVLSTGLPQNRPARLQQQSVHGNPSETFRTIMAVPKYGPAPRVW